jgi:hypothetical protein
MARYNLHLQVTLIFRLKLLRRCIKYNIYMEHQSLQDFVHTSTSFFLVNAILDLLEINIMAFCCSNSYSLSQRRGVIAFCTPHDWRETIVHSQQCHNLIITSLLLLFRGLYRPLYYVCYTLLVPPTN